MKIYREVLIARAEQAEAMPAGTVALQSWGHGTTARTLTDGHWITPSGASLPHAELVGFAALVPIEAAAANIWDQGYDAGTDDENAHQRGVTPDELSQYTPNPYRAT